MLEVQDLKIHFSLQGGLFRPPRVLRAVDGVSLRIGVGETLGIVGESGCGKSTLVRGILGLTPVTSGSIRWQGQELTQLNARQFRPLRTQMQIVFQDPLASLDPRMTIGEIIAEPLQVHRPKLGSAQVQAQVRAMLERVGLSPRQLNRYPHEFSGGQCQRVGIARALILAPQLLLCDEPVSALDVSIRAQIINLLHDLQQEMGLALAFIAHDLLMVRHLSHRVMVMYLGQVMETAPSRTLFTNPSHPYTRALLAAVLKPDPMGAVQPPPVLGGELPSPLDPPSGCRFRTRCPHAVQRCADEVPSLRPMPNGASSACHFAEAVLAGDLAPFAVN